jgi:hypothetical protein
MLALALAAAISSAEPSAVNHARPGDNAQTAERKDNPPQPTPSVSGFDPSAPRNYIGGDKINQHGNGPSPGELGLIVVGILQVAVLAWQIRYLGKTLTHERKSTERELRAYVMAGDTSKFEVSGTVIHLFQFENTGKTPTRNAIAQVNVWNAVEDFPAEFDFVDAATDGPHNVELGPGQKAQFEALRISPEDALLVSAGESFIYVWGWIEYNDVFDHTPRRRTEFCRRFMVNPEGGGRRWLWTNATRFNGTDGRCSRPIQTTGEEIS